MGEEMGPVPIFDTSHLLVPVTRGNRIGTYLSGGTLLPPLPNRQILPHSGA